MSKKNSPIAGLTSCFSEMDVYDMKQNVEHKNRTLQKKKEKKNAQTTQKQWYMDVL